MSVSFRIAATGLSEDESDTLSRRLIKDAAEEQLQLNLSPGRANAPGGQRGDAFTVGALMLSLVTSGTVVALFNLLKSYVERTGDFSIEFMEKNGAPFKLSMKNVSLEKFQEVLRDFEDRDG
ncbi:MAG TPA: hypothetical protein VN838_22275 [Bradyrhizobium sp.]|nr:hypothetical protein [Bradyrhizobium sp.]